MVCNQKYNWNHSSTFLEPFGPPVEKRLKFLRYPTLHVKATRSTSLRFHPFYPRIHRQKWDKAKQTFQIQSNTKAVNQKDILWRGGHTLCSALHSISLQGILRKKTKKSKTQESMLCFWSKGEISVTNAMTNISGKINKFSSERCVESWFIPWAVFLITVDIYRP